MDDVNKILEVSEEAAKNAFKELEEQTAAINNLPEGLEKETLKQAALKAKAGDLEGVQKILRKLDYGSTS